MLDKDRDLGGVELGMLGEILRDLLLDEGVLALGPRTLADIWPAHLPKTGGRALVVPVVVGPAGEGAPVVVLGVPDRLIQIDL